MGVGLLCTKDKTVPRREGLFGGGEVDWLLAGEELDTQQEEAQFLRMAVVKGGWQELG